MRIALIVGGIIAILLGGLWTLQGLSVVGGSAMSGHTIWAIVGPLVAVIGLAALLVGARRRSAS
jgi:hypothetical protein